MVERLPLLRWTLARALNRWTAGIGGAPTPGWLSTIWQHSNESNWETYVREGCYQIVANNLNPSDPDVDLVFRAARNLKQAGKILWDEPETDEQRANEQPYLDAIARRQSKLDEISQKRRSISERRQCPILTDEEKAALRDPTTPLIPNARLGSWSRRFSKYLIPTIKTFYWHDARVGYAGVNADDIVARLIRAGIVDVVEVPGSKNWRGATGARLQLGPKYLAYMKRWNLKADRIQKHLWEKLVAALNEKWGTNFDASEWTDERNYD